MSCVGLAVVRVLFLGCACCLLFDRAQMSQSDTVPVYSTPFPSFRRSSSMLRGFMCPSLRYQMSASAMAAYTTPGTSSWETLSGLPLRWNIMASEHIPWSRGSCLSEMKMLPKVRCRLPTSSTNLTPFSSSAVEAKMLRLRPGTTSAGRLTGSWAPWLSRMVNEMVSVRLHRLCVSRRL